MSSLPAHLRDLSRAHGLLRLCAPTSSHRDAQSHLAKAARPECRVRLQSADFRARDTTPIVLLLYQVLYVYMVLYNYTSS